MQDPRGGFTLRSSQLGNPERPDRIASSFLTYPGRTPV